MTGKNRLVGVMFSVLLWGLPFYLPLAVYLSSLATTESLIILLSGWSELIMVVLVVLLAPLFYPVWRMSSTTVRLLCGLMIALVLLYGVFVFSAGNILTFVSGFLIGTRFILFFLLAMAAAALYTLRPDTVVRIAIVSGLTLAILAILQFVIIPRDILVYIGYEAIGQDIIGIPPAYTTLGDDTDGILRPQATLRGPNSLGAYLILTIVAFIYFMRDRIRKRLHLIVAITGFLFLVSALFLTFSRSAWLGTFMSFVIIGVVLVIRHKKSILHSKLALASLVSLVLIVVFAAVNMNPTGSLILFRTDSGVTGEPDSIRLQLIRDSARQIAGDPVGIGPGNAGPASILDETNPGLITENYFLQVAREVGWIGLILLIAIHVVLLKILWELWRKKTPYSLVALATLAGFIVANMTLHTWAEDAAAITWWVFAGAIVGTSIKNKQHRHLPNPKE